MVLESLMATKQDYRLTASSMLNLLVHLIRVPDAMDVWRTGNENVNPSSLCFPSSRRALCSLATNLANVDAMKPNRSC
jgi:hypothetical protein